MAELNRIRDSAFENGQFKEQSFLGAFEPSAMRLQRYLVRSTLDSPAATSAMFARMVDVGEDWLAAQQIRRDDQRAYMAVLVAMQMGMYLMADQISAALGVDVSTPEGHIRMLSGAVDIFAYPLLTEQEAVAMREAMAKTLTQTPEE